MAATTVSWSTAKAWGFTPDYSRVGAGEPQALTCSARIAPSSLSAGSEESAATTTRNERLAALAAFTLTAIAKCQGAEAIVVVGLNGATTKAAHPILNPLITFDRNKPAVELIREVERVAFAVPAGTTAMTVAEMAASVRTTSSPSAAHHSSKPPSSSTKAANSSSSNAATLGTIAILDALTYGALGADDAIRCFEVIFVLSDNVPATKSSKSSAAANQQHPPRGAVIDMCYNGRLFNSAFSRDRVELAAHIATEYFAGTDGTDLWAPQTLVSELPSTTPAMRDRLLRDWQSPRIPVASYDRTLVDLFLEGAACCADPAATDCIVESATGHSITYAAIIVRARRLARHLVALLPNANWGEDATCGIHLQRGVDWFTVSLAVHMAGGSYLSLDPSFPSDRLIFSLEDSGGVVLFTRRDTMNALDFDGGPKLAVDENFWAEIDGIDDDSEPFAYRAQPGTPAYLLYTSGSTGKPKGVCVEQRSVVNFILGDMVIFGKLRKQRVAQCATTSFDMSIEEIWVAFATGSTLVTVDKEALHDADLFAKILREQRITFMSVTPTLLATVGEAALATVQMVIVGGEACTQDVVAAHSRSGRRLFNSYGPTEATVACTAIELRPGEPVTIGRAIPGYFACVVNSDMELVPPGVPGELCISGPGVARGYVKRQDLTDEKFGPCPYESIPKANDPAFEYDDATAHDERYGRLYHTGDLCRFNPEGMLEFLGRIDLQVKLRGFRIEIEEIENVLQSYPGVKLAIVAKLSQHGVEFLCGYMQMADGSASPSDADVSTHLRKKLPAYMVPQRFMAVTNFARTPAGKIDRKSLPEPPSVADSRRDRHIRAPTTPTQERVLAVWKSVFTSMGDISVDDDFFDDLGGTSILAGRVITLLRKAGFELSARVMYENATIARFAAYTDSQNSLNADGNRQGGAKLEPPQPDLPAFRRPSAVRRALIGTWQFLIGLLAVSNIWIIILPLEEVVKALGVKLHATQFGLPFVVGIILAFGLVVIQLFFLLVLLPLLKWLIIQRRQPGQYWIYSWYGVRWWTVRALYDAFPLILYSHMNILGWIYRLGGASIGSGCILPAIFTEPDLLTIGDDVHISFTAQLLTSQVMDQQLILKRIRIGNGATIEAGGTVEGGAIVPDRCVVRPMATVEEGHVVREGCEWVAPGRDNGDAPALPTEAVGQDTGTNLLNKSRPARPSTGVRCLVGTAQCFTLFVIFTVMMTMHYTMVYSMVLIGQAVATRPIVMSLTAVGVSFLGACLGALWYVVFGIICGRLVQPSFKGFEEGTFAVTSMAFQRWFMFQKVYILTMFLYPMLGTVFARWWARRMGVNVGENTDFGLVASITPGLTDFGDDCFVADFATINPPFVHGGYLTFRRMTVGSGTMIGNNTVVTCRSVGSKVMVGAATWAPDDVPDDKMVVGAPYMLGTRHSQRAEADVYEVGSCLTARHALHNFMDVIAGQWITFVSIVLAIATAELVKHAWNPITALLLFVFTLELSKTALLILFKWTMNAKLKPTTTPLHSPLCWRYQWQFALMLAIMPMGVLYVYRGSMLYPWILRLLGMKIGTNSWIDTIQIPETDLAIVGSDCSINTNVTLGTHAAEDGLMKFGRVSCGNRVSLGSGSIIAPTARVGTGCTIAPNSAVSKGERLEDRTHWRGITTERVPAPPLMRVSAAPRNADGGVAVEMTPRHTA